ncbi:DUF7344 domain-containing protein [Halorarius halobius]|uniref:DUF7344 domain-containing protein n=1 Tax=Halorarius halobius TaxID=2962671 RepID=UPI0020CBCA0B|nr:hypothetical protein [Halorarius halobius]
MVDTGEQPAVEEETTEGTGEAGLSSETLFDVLTAKRRRYVLHHLKQRGEEVPVRDLAEQVAAWENDKPVEALSSKERKRVYVSLYQSHLSTLDDEGIVEYDQDRGVVALSAAADEIDVYMEVVPGEDIPWSRFYLGLTLAGGIALALVYFDVRPFTTVPDIGWAAVVLVVFGGAALVQTAASNRMRFGDPGPPPELEGESE